MEDKLLSPSPSWFANTVTVCKVVRLCLLQSSYMASVTALLCSLQKSLSNGGERMSINTSTFYVSFHPGCQVTSHLSLCQPSLN